jgi:hypothetical protein
MSSDGIICIIHGANTPFLIWRDKTSSDARPVCNLVGECYLHGMMNEERIRNAARLGQQRYDIPWH